MSHRLHGDALHKYDDRVKQGAEAAKWTPGQGEHYRLEMHRHAEEKAALLDALDLDALEAQAAEAVLRTYGRMSHSARFWAQKGIEGMRLAVAEAKERVRGDV